MLDYYILEDKIPKRVKSVKEWGKWFESAERYVKRDTINNVDISTVFLGLDHNWGWGPPLLFETMVFGGKYDGFQERCSFWGEAEVQHKAVCALVRDGRCPDTDDNFCAEYQKQGKLCPNCRLNSYERRASDNASSR